MISFETTIKGKKPTYGVAPKRPTTKYDKDLEDCKLHLTFMKRMLERSVTKEDKEYYQSCINSTKKQIERLEKICADL